MTDASGGPIDPQEPVHYAWVTGRRVSTGPAAARSGNAIGKFLVEPIIGRRGITIGSEGVTLHKIIGADRMVPYSDIREVKLMRSFNQGDHIVLVLEDGAEVKLPAPTSKTAGNVNEARQLIEVRRTR